MVADGARLGADVEIGPHCVIGPHVSLGDGCRLISHVSIQGHTTIGPRAVIQPFASLGTPAQSVHYKGEASTLIVGSDADIREHVTMNIGTAGGRMETRVGDRVMMMVGSHIGHDCVIGNDVIFANNSILGGHVEVGDHVFFGALCGVHQFVRIGEHAMLAGLIAVRRDVIPYGAVNAKGALAGLNLIGLKRRGFPREVIHRLRAVYRELFLGAGVLAERNEQIAKSHPGDPEVQRIVEFVRGSAKRKLTLPNSAEDE